MVRTVFVQLTSGANNMSGYSLQTIGNALSPAVTAADRNAGNKIANLASDQTPKKVLDVQSAKSELGIVADLQATLTKAFTADTGKILDKFV